MKRNTNVALSLKLPKITWAAMLRSNWKIDGFLQIEGNLKILNSL